MTTKAKTKTTLDERERDARKAYLAGDLSHDAYYGWLASELGTVPLDRLVLQVAPLEKLREALATDRNLNNIRLDRWDLMHTRVLVLVGQAGKRFWSLSDTVCVLKCRARVLVEGEKGGRS